MKKFLFSAAVSVLTLTSLAPIGAAAEEIKLPSGVVVAIEGKSTGAQKPKSNSVVTVQYEGSLTNGTVFDSS